jgi:hypothetical protein
MYGCQRTQCPKAKLAGFGELDITGDQHGVNVLKVNLSVIIDELAQFRVFRTFPVQYDVVSADFVPAWLKDGFRKNHSGGAVVVDEYLGGANFFDQGNVEGTFRLIAHRDEFAYDERVAVDFVEIGIGVGLGLRGAKGQVTRSYRRFVVSSTAA